MTTTRAELLAQAVSGNVVSAEAWNRHARVINGQAQARRVSPQDGGAGGELLVLIDYESEVVAVPIYEADGTPTSYVANVELVTSRTYQDADGNLITVDDSYLRDLYP